MSFDRFSGAPAAWIPPITVEIHRPLIFLNIKTATDIAGLQATLTEEDSTTMLSLPLIQQASDDVRLSSSLSFLTNHFHLELCHRSLGS